MRAGRPSDHPGWRPPGDPRAAHDGLGRAAHQEPGTGAQFAL